LLSRGLFGDRGSLQAGVRAVDKTVRTLGCAFVGGLIVPGLISLVTKLFGDGADGPRVAFCTKAVRICARRAAFYTKAPAIDVVGNCDGRHLPLSLGKY
jgi:hypothetical protein